MGALRARTGLALSLLCLAALRVRYDLAAPSGRGNLAIFVESMPLFLLALWLLARARLAPRTGVVLVLAAGIVFQVVALAVAPRSSDDDYRYIWDAKVQLAGIDPYRYPPVATQLAQLREPFLFAPATHCTQPVGGTCPRMNRPTVRTVYPPVAEDAFVLLRLLSFGGHGGHLPLQLAAAIGVLLTGLLLARHLLARGSPVWLLALWLWCPITASEFGNSAHIDWLAILLTIAALTCSRAGRHVPAAILIGAGVATKLYPAAVVPSLLRRRPVLVIAVSATTVVVSYLPHVFAVGPHVFGYLPDYLRDEQYVSGDRLLLLGAVLPHPLDTLIGLGILAAAGVWAWLRTDPDRPEDTAVVLVGVALLVTTPNYSWYAGLLLALIAMSGAWEWLPVALAPSVTYLYVGLHPHSVVPRASYAIALGLTAAGMVIRSHTRRAAPAMTAPDGMSVLGSGRS